MIEDLVTLTNEYFLSQLIQKPTHKNGNTLDLLFTNNPRILHSHNVMDTVFSDHEIVECLTTYNTTTSKEQQHPENIADAATGLGSFNFFSEDTDWWRIDHELAQQNWKLEFRGSNTRQMLGKLLEICENLVAKYVPTRKKSITPKMKNFIPRDRKNLMRKRRRINVQLMKTTNEVRRKKLKEHARQIEKELTKSYQQSQKVSEEKAVNSIKRNSKYFFYLC